MQTKTCRRCGETKALPEFIANKRRKDGFDSACKSCENARSRKKYANNLESERARSRLYRETNYEKERERARLKSIRDKDAVKLRSKKYRLANPDSVSATRHRRRALEKGNAHSDYTESQIIEKYGMVCHLCSGPIDPNAPRWTALPGWENGLHLDHIVPLCVGGANNADNVRPAHGLCNLRKPKKLTSR